MLMIFCWQIYPVLILLLETLLTFELTIWTRNFWHSIDMPARQ